jgi:hypothetical protein
MDAKSRMAVIAAMSCMAQDSICKHISLNGIRHLHDLECSWLRGGSSVEENLKDFQETTHMPMPASVLSDMGVPSKEGIIFSLIMLIRNKHHTFFSSNEAHKSTFSFLIGPKILCTGW